MKDYLNIRKETLHAQRTRGIQMQREGLQMQNNGAELVVAANAGLSEIALMEKEMDKPDGTDENS